MSKSDDPRISVAELGKYLQSGPLKRRDIVRDQKDPKPFKVAYYDDARRAIAAYLRDDNLDLGALEKVLEKLEAKLDDADSDWEKQRLRGNIDAIETFADIELPDGFGDADRSDGKKHKAKLTLGGLSVSVQPELLILRDAGAKTKASAGAVHLYFSTTVSLQEDAALNVATLLHQYSEQQFAETHAARRDDCLLIDVFARKTWSAPLSWKMRRKHLLAACEEITARWPTL